MLTEEQKLLIRELNSYNYLHIKLADLTEVYVNSLQYLDDKIARIDSELNEYHVPAIKYDAVSINQIKTTHCSRVVELLTEQEVLEKKKELKVAEQQKEVHKIAQRIDDVDLMLKKLTAWEREFITHMYIESKCMEYMMDNYNFKSRTSVYRLATVLLNKMIKK